MTYCNICLLDKDEPQTQHEMSKRHQMNLYLMDWHKYRKGLAKNREGLSVNAKLIGIPNNTDFKFSEVNGVYTVQCSLEAFQNINKTVTLKFTAKNERKTDVCLLEAFTLHPVDNFQIEDTMGLITGINVANLKGGSSYSVNLKFNTNDDMVGSYKISIGFIFQWFKNNNTQEETLAVVKEVVIVIGENYEAAPKLKNKPKLRLHELPEYFRKTIREDKFSIPRDHQMPFATGLTQFPGIRQDEKLTTANVKTQLEKWYDSQEGSYIPNTNFYTENMHNLLWLDEMGLILQLHIYDLEKIKVHCACDLIKIEVQGLAEKRPSILVGDSIHLRLHGTSLTFTGKIFKIHQNHIYVNQFSNDIYKYAQKPQALFDVTFRHNRISYIREHECIENIESLKAYLFPNPSLGQRFVIPTERPVLYNSRIETNREQLDAVTNILNNTARTAPYVIFGPPGTGKTATLVEAILQIAKNYPRKVILVSAPSNSACDNIMTKLLTSNMVFSKQVLRRFYAKAREESDIPHNIFPYSNKYGRSDFNTLKIIISTLVHSGLYKDCIKADILIIDEAAQARESELCIVLSMLKPGGQLVIAGDPKQLGPVALSNVATKYGASLSFLKRLITTNPLYKDRHPNFLSMLRQNYRNHMSIIKLPNDLFYNGQLQPLSRTAHEDTLAVVSLYAETNKIKRKVCGYPCEFWCVNAKEQQDGRSPSFFNPKEVDAIVRLVRTLLNLRNIKVEEDDIGIITPYNRQVHKLKDALKRHPNIEIGSVEIFQGREKRVIIISTVRAQHSLLLHDKKYNLGFVKNPERFNVAITRAISKLVVVGNPQVLTMDENWNKLIMQCKENNSLYGKILLSRSEVETTAVIHRQRRVRNEKNRKAF